MAVTDVGHGDAADQQLTTGWEASRSSYHIVCFQGTMLQSISIGAPAQRS